MNRPSLERTDEAVLRVLPACLRPLAAPDRIDAIGVAVAAPFDADRLLLLCRRHRVAGSSSRGSRRWGRRCRPAGRLAVAARGARVQLLRTAGEEVWLDRALAAAGINGVFVEGATTAMCAHGSLAFTTSWDIDLLVSRGQMDAAGTVLAASGCRLSILEGVTDPAQVRRFLASKEAEWVNDARGTVVEPHTELSDSRTAITGVGLGAPRPAVARMPDAGVETLAPAPLFAYRAFHGTAHLWSRLKWLVDVAALLRGADAPRSTPTRWRWAPGAPRGRDRPRP